MPSVDPAVFRQLCGRFATGVVVVSITDPQGQPLGMTVNSFASVSLDPPLVSINIDHRATLHGRLVEAERFVLNILESHQETVSRRFAGESPDRFDGVGYRLNRDGLPVLSGTLGAIECARHATFEAGDHTIVLGRVTGGEAAEGRPLLYYRGGYYDLPRG
jgi:3-hydroxy-9,10-secoandrosta-1,3,5(10)-triene-9,17-dione monooxygenase reductase component